MKNNGNSAPAGGQLMSPQLQRANFGGVPGPPVPPGSQPNQLRGTGAMTKSHSAEPPAVWKPPPPHGAISGKIFGTIFCSSYHFIGSDVCPVFLTHSTSYLQVFPDHL